MANETVTPPQVDPKATANNIVKGIQQKANGKAPTAPPITEQPSANPSADPNAGKEKYVVEGREVWLTPEQARAYVQKGIAFEPRVDQLARLQHETAAFLETLKTDPLRILTDKRIGLTPEIVLEKVLKSDKISDQIKESVGHWYYENVVEPMKLSPEELKARENEKKVSKYEQESQQREENRINQENTLRVQNAMNQIRANIAEAMKESGLPSIDTALGSFMARRVADVMRLGYFQRRAVTPKEAIATVKNEMKQVQTAYYDTLDEDQLVKELGEKNAEKVKKYFLKLVKAAEKAVPGNQTMKPARRNERATTSLDEFHEYLDQLKRNGK